ncbi:TolC family protein [Thalassoroseus pseudoceratinae]|uniref:TolC family protein n=1 Tax=Thalassoroseus pseudoceratinae TaxID=2713176 RepID=UPI001420E2EF|nr:TolC family protein [Thalassoroseus pseudoceratinae]
MRAHSIRTFFGGVCVSLTVGCTTPPTAQTDASFVMISPDQADRNAGEIRPELTTRLPMIGQVAAEDPDANPGNESDAHADRKMENSQEQSAPEPALVADDGLEYLVQISLDQNPRLARLYQEYQAAAARTQYADKLPDPKVGANVFGNALETASGSQRANFNVSQVFPWLSRLDAQQQRACLEALAIQAEWAAEQLRVVAGVRTGWYRLYIIDKQIEIAEANQELLESLIEVANARIAAGNASQGDVLLGTVELSKLEERLLSYRRQRQGVEAELNRLTAQPAETPISSPTELEIELPKWSSTEIHEVALRSQPEIEAARLRTQATRWGIEVARLQRRPEFMVSANYFVTDDNRPPSRVVDVGEDPFSLSVQVSIPLWRDDYDAIENEAAWKHQAAHSSVRELVVRYNSMILDLLTEARRADETAELYKSTILPQSRQTLTADQEAYVNGTVEFDRVIRDYRNLLTLELGYHKAIGDLAIAIARIQQAAGQDLLLLPSSSQTPQLPQPDPVE